ncbi:MAG: hypothetical protein ACK4UY_01290 [Dietzia sp.]
MWLIEIRDDLRKHGLTRGWEVSAERVTEVVDEAVRTIAARYATTTAGRPQTTESYCH